MRYIYLKKNPQNQKSPVKHKIFSLGMVAVGFVLVLSVTAPLFIYQFVVSPSFRPMVKPMVDQSVLGDQVQAGTDYTKVSSWFPTAPRPTSLPSKITHYNLSVPKVRINKAVVQIGGDDLNSSLIQYEGTAFPGQFGNTVIFGHSILPQFYNPKSYKTIFSLLPTLKIKDPIILDFDGITYKYEIEQMTEVKPTDISILEQRYDDSYLTLITCVPPGTYLRRLAVRARLTK
jgi:sortase A